MPDQHEHRPLTREYIAGLVHDVDKNKDNKVNFEEFQKLLDAIFAPAPAPAAPASANLAATTASATAAATAGSAPSGSADAAGEKNKPK